MKFALIGNSVVLSPSDYLHGLLFERNNVKADYDKVFVDELTRGKYLEINEKYDGFNVTMPYKTRIIPFLSEVKTPFGAVNTVKKGVGFNTDVFGAESALRENFPDLGENVLIMGNGGAARALYFAVKRASKKGVRITFAVRDIAKAEDFSLFRDSETVVYSQIRPCFDYIINATSVGYKNDCILISDEIIAASDGVFDVVYSAKKTNLSLSCEKLGKKYVDGIPMLVRQAAYAQAIWLGNDSFSDYEESTCDFLPSYGELSEIENLVRKFVVGG